MHVFALVLVPPDSRDIAAAVAQCLAPYYVRHAFPCQKKRYLDARELHQMRVGPGSPLLAAAIQSLKDPLESWLSEDPGVDSQGFYEWTELDTTPWDWWCIGGRWDGLLQGQPRIDQACCSSPTEHLQRNCERASRLINVLFAWIVVTPDGQWHEGQWWNDTEQARNGWQRTLNRLLSQYANCLAIGVDCHV